MHPKRANRVEHGQHHHADVGEDRDPHVGDTQRAKHEAGELDDRARTRCSGRRCAMHLREMRMALAIFIGSSSISTTSAASMAASEPIAPIAMPISARLSTGASLMPSPTKASFRLRPSRRAAPRPARPYRPAAARCGPRPRPSSAATCVGHRFGVAGEHDRLVHARVLERCDGLLGVRLDHVGDDDVARVLRRQWPCG